MTGRGAWEPDPMTAEEAREYGPQWGSYMMSGDPGYIMYTAIPPERAAHRDEMVSYLQHRCLPIARANDDQEGDVEMIHRLCAYLDGLEYVDNDESGHCRHCGRDNSGHEAEACSDDCPRYWEAIGRERGDA